MRLVDFLIFLLQTQGRSLQRLAAFFGEEELLQMLEESGEASENNRHTFHFDGFFSSLVPAQGTPKKGSGYSELEIAVNELKLPAVLEFHLWAYPFYRSIVENTADLSLTIKSENNPIVDRLVNEAVTQASLWVKSLPMSPELSAAAEQAAMVPWLRFRTEVLKKLGKRPFVAV